jgi:hypothetical protein
MRNLLSIVVGLLFTLISCNDSVTIPKSDYNKLKDVKTQTKRTITFPDDSKSDFYTWTIIKASDGHDYLENNGDHGYSIMHYVECNKCKNK